MQPAPATSEVTLRLNREQLDKLRKAHGIESESELARRIGVERSTLWRVSNGEASPSPAFIARVMVAFPTAQMGLLFEVQRVLKETA
jgi:transcriptional regulator with XRE-family HTH domain